MRVLQYPPDREVFEFTCNGAGNSEKGCGAVLEAERKDLRWFNGYGSYFNKIDNAVTAKCPLCNKVSDLPKELWPKLPSTLEPDTPQWRLPDERSSSRSTKSHT